MSNRKVKITFKSEMVPGPGGELVPYQKPDFETTVDNLPNQERMHGDKIKEVIYADEKGKYPEKKPTRSTVYKPKFTINDVTPEIRAQLKKEFETEFSGTNRQSVPVITNETLIAEFRKRGKTDLSIAKYLEMDVKEVQKVV